MFVGLRKKWRDQIGQTKTILGEKVREALASVVPITLIVLILSLIHIFTMPIAIGGRTSFTLANIMCCLSGLLLGPVGGFASGLGSAIYDLTNPAYAPE